jgi:hypothetical protein
MIELRINTATADKTIGSQSSGIGTISSPPIY